MKDLNIEYRLKVIEEHVIEIRTMLRKLLDKREVSTPTENAETVLSVKQLAQFLGVDVNIVYAKCAKGEIPYFKMGRQFRFKKNEVLDWIKDQKKLPEISVGDFVDRYMQTHLLKG